MTREEFLRLLPPDAQDRVLLKLTRVLRWLPTVNTSADSRHAAFSYLHDILAEFLHAGFNPSARP